MNKFKFFCTAAAATALLTATASAAGSDGVNVVKLQMSTDSVLTVNVNYPTDYSGVGTAYVVPEASLEAAKNRDMSSVVFMGEKDPTNYLTEFSFLMPDGAANGVYVVVSGENIKADDVVKNSRYFRYNSDKSAVSARLSALNTATDFETALTDGATDAWYIDTELSGWKNKKTAVLSLMQSMKGSGFISSFEVEDAFLLACGIADIANSTDGEVLADLLHYTNLLGNDVANTDFVKYPEQTAGKFKLLAAESMPLSTGNAQKLFKTACALSRMSNTDRTTSINDLKDYNDIFELSFTGDFSKVSEFELAKVFEGKNYTTVKQVKDDFTNGIADLIKEDNGIGGVNGNTGTGTGALGGFGGGGGGTGGGSQIIEEINTVSQLFSDVATDH